VFDPVRVSLAINGAFHRALRTGAKKVVFDFSYPNQANGTSQTTLAFDWIKPEEITKVFAVVRRMFGIPDGAHEFCFAPTYRYNPQLIPGDCRPEHVIDYHATHTVTAIFDEPGKRLVFAFKMVKAQTCPKLQKTTEPLFRRR